MGGLLPRLSILTYIQANVGGLFLLHFLGSRLRLTLSAILPCEARTFLTVIPFGSIPRDRSAKLPRYYNTNAPACQEARAFLFFTHPWGDRKAHDFTYFYALFSPISSLRTLGILKSIIAATTVNTVSGSI